MISYFTQTIAQNNIKRLDQTENYRPNVFNKKPMISYFTQTFTKTFWQTIKTVADF